MSKGGGMLLENGHCSMNIRPENSPANYDLQEHWEDTLLLEKETTTLLRDLMVAIFSET